jgi:hypothetical protein
MMSRPTSPTTTWPVTAKIARAHLNEFPDYYSRLAVIEAEAQAYWGAEAK